MPLSENDAAAAAHYETVTDTLKLISDYTRLNFNEIMELDCCIYKLYFRDAYIYMMKQTKEGEIKQTLPYGLLRVSLKIKI